MGAAPTKMAHTLKKKYFQSCDLSISSNPERN